MTDKEIIYLYNSGQREQAFNHIVKDYSERLYLHIRRFVYSHDDADDLVQEVFIKIWAALPSFRGGTRSFLRGYTVSQRTRHSTFFANRSFARYSPWTRRTRSLSENLNKMHISMVTNCRPSCRKQSSGSRRSRGSYSTSGISTR